MSSIHSLQLWMDQPLPPFINQPDVTSWECADFKCWPPEHKSHGCHSRAKREELEDTARSCGQVTLPGATGKVSPLRGICLPSYSGAIENTGAALGYWGKAPMWECGNCAFRAYPWLAARETGAQKVPLEGNLGKYGRSQHSWDVIFHLPPATQSACLTQEHKSWLGLSCSVCWETPDQPLYHTWWNSPGKTRLELFLHCFQAIKDSQTLWGAQNVQVSMSDLQAAWDLLIMLAVRMAIYVALLLHSTSSSLSFPDLGVSNLSTPSPSA